MVSRIQQESIMAIPDYQTLMLPLLQLASDGGVHSKQEAVEKLTQKFSLSSEEKSELLPSGTQTIIYNRVGWAQTYMKKAGLLASPKRGHFQITDRGKELLKEKPQKVGVKLLSRYEEFSDFKSIHRTKDDETLEAAVVDDFATPEEAIEYGYQKVVATLSEELLSKVKECTPSFFERLVVDLLVSMGYGGSRKEAGEVLGKSGDGGIDGIIKEDKLGLDIIYIQAKRWDNVVGRPEIQKFAGALLGQKARKGIFITTSSFTKEAAGYAKGLETKVILVDGSNLARLMIDHDLGVSTTASYQVKRVDSDYFVED